MKKFFYLMILFSLNTQAFEEETVAQAIANVEKSLSAITYKTLDKDNMGLRQGLSMGQMENLLKVSGFRDVKSKIDGEGLIKLSAKLDKLPFIIQGDNCIGEGSKQRCQYFEIAASFFDSKNPYNQDLMNQWNIDQRWSKAYLSQENEAILTQEIHAPFATAASILYALEGWRHSLAEFTDHINW
ncbi:MAG: YbjN domain-containing protein [Alphaproteobacteria bacterium]